MNLLGIAENDSSSYQQMQAYYRNIGLWLAKPAQRQSMLILGTWGVLIGSPPMEFSRKDSPWQIGERVLAALEVTASRTMPGEFVSTFFSNLQVAAASSEASRPESAWSGVPDDLANRALVGAIGSALLDLAFDHRETRSRGQRPRLDANAIRERVIKGVSHGQTLLKKSVDDAACAIQAARDALAADTKPQRADVLIPIEVRRIRGDAESC